MSRLHLFTIHSLALRPAAGTAAAALALILFGCALSGCGHAPAPLVVGSQNLTGQIIAGEIVAQHLEHRLGRKVERRPGIGGELDVYQELQLQHISLYPAFTGAIESKILKEHADSDPAIVWERSHSELSRLANMELFSPLGYDNPPAMVVHAADAATLKTATLSQAATLSQSAAGSTKWKIGVSYEFLQRSDAIAALNSYKLPAEPIRGMEPSAVFPAFDRGDLSMIGADSIDGRLTSPDYRVLADDRHAFPVYQACLLTRQDVLAAEPRLRAFLFELSGKFTTEGMRKLSAEVDLQHRKPADVAAEFLAQAGLQ